MKWKAFLLASLCVFVTVEILDYLIHSVILMPTYESLKHLWRPDMESKMWIVVLVALIWSVLFTLIFIKGYEGRGWLEGVRFGLLIGLFWAIPMAYGSYAMYPIPYSLALQWFLYGLVESILAGIVVALVYGRLAGASAPRSA
jgi:hypothetical protein